MSSIIYRNDSEEFDSVIHSLISGLDWVSVDHGQEYLNYHYCRHSLQSDVTDISFVVSLEDKYKIAAIGLVSNDEQINDLPIIVYESNYPMLDKLRKDFLLEFEKVIDKYKSKNIIIRDFVIDGKLSFFSKYLLRKGAISYPMFHQVINLKQPIEIIKKNIRKSYKSLINYSTSYLDIQVFDSDNITHELIMKIMNLHTSIVGHSTRPLELWTMQYNLVKNNCAFVVVGLYKKNIVSAGIFGFNHTNCIYQMSISDRSMFSKPMFHGLMMKAIDNAIELGCNWFEIGEQVFLNHPIDIRPSKKEIDISSFKAGFGNETRMFLDLKLEC